MIGTNLQIDQGNIVHFTVFAVAGSHTSASKWTNGFFGGN